MLYLHGTSTEFLSRTSLQIFFSPRSEIVTSDSSVTSTSGKQLHSDGLEYDSILQIDVSDDSPALKLPLNKGGE